MEKRADSISQELLDAITLMRGEVLAQQAVLGLIIEGISVLEPQAAKSIKLQIAKMAAERASRAALEKRESVIEHSFIELLLSFGLCSGTS